MKTLGDFTEYKMDFENSFKNSFRGLIEKGDHIVIGLSGGPDSVCLFHKLVEARKEMSLELYAAHLNHRFRPGAAEEDERYARGLSERFGVPFFNETLDVNALAREWGMSSEEAGRKARYDLFRDIAMRVEKGEIVEPISPRNTVPKNKIKIAVAHNKNDNAETVLLRLIRGTGPDGLAGIPEKRLDNAGYEIVRPLLNTTREEIENYCRKYNLEPRFDHTNDEAIYGRNKVRLELLPLMSTYNPNIIDAIVRLASLSSNDKEYFDEIVKDFLKKNLRVENETHFFIKKELLIELPQVLRSRVIREIFAKLGAVEDFSKAQAESAEAFIFVDTGKVADMFSGYKMRVVYDDIEFFTTDEADEGQIELGELQLEIMPVEEWKTLDDKLGVAFDLDLIERAGGLPELRTRKAGDYIQIEVGTKKLKDYFIDIKVPRSKRDLIPLVATGDEILWIPGYRKSFGYKIKDDTKRVLVLEYKPYS